MIVFINRVLSINKHLAQTGQIMINQNFKDKTCHSVKEY